MKYEATGNVSYRISIIVIGVDGFVNVWFCGFGSGSFHGDYDYFHYYHWFGEFDYLVHGHDDNFRHVHIDYVYDDN